MKKMSNVKKAVIAAVCIALCYVLPLFFHGIQNAGSIFLPMHIPVFLCGLICGWQYGLLCGIAGPILSSVLTGMPPVAKLPSMVIELAIYGVITGLMMKLIHTGKTYADLYISLIVAMICGRIVAGCLQAFIFAAGTYSMGAWVTAYIVTRWPGTLIQLIFIPTIVVALMKSRIMPERYPKQK